MRAFIVADLVSVMDACLQQQATRTVSPVWRHKCILHVNCFNIAHSRQLVDNR